MSHPSNAPNMGKSFDANRTTLRAAPDFEHATDPPGEPSQEQAKYEVPEHNYDHPEMTPGGSSYAPSVNEVAREALPDRTQKAMRQAQEGFERGESEDGGPVELSFEEHEAMKKGREPLDKSYEQWSREGEDERNEASNTPEAAAEFDKDMEKRLQQIRQNREREAPGREQ